MFGVTNHVLHYMFNENVEV